MARIIIIIYLVWLVFSDTVAYAKSTAPAHIDVQERINITVRQLSPIAFGSFASSDSGGTIKIDAASGEHITTGNISTLSAGDYGQAEFAISGQPGQEIVVTPPASVTLGETIAGNMVITDFKIVPGEILTLDNRGSAKIKIGGVLKIPGRVPQGNYSGLFNVSVRYTK